VTIAADGPFARAAAEHRAPDVARVIVAVVHLPDRPLKTVERPCGCLKPRLLTVPFGFAEFRGGVSRSVRQDPGVVLSLVYLGVRDGVIAGGASLRVAEGVAQLTGAATAPAHRRRGVQTALLSARLADAAAAGCDIAVVTTQPGSKSQQNVQRRGFDLLYTRAVLVKQS